MSHTREPHTREPRTYDADINGGIPGQGPARCGKAPHIGMPEGDLAVLDCVHALPLRRVPRSVRLWRSG